MERVKNRLYRKVLEKPDGRYFVVYQSNPEPIEIPEDMGLTRGEGWQPPHKRYNALKRQWVAISASRQNRPFLPPKDYCPLCPQKEIEGKRYSTEIPDFKKPYQLAAFENMYPALSMHGSKPTGYCEVLLYTSQHDTTLASLNKEQLMDVIEMWQDRSHHAKTIQGIEQIQIFENKGVEIGVTLHHPHGQLYAWDHIPPMLKTEQDACQEYFQDHDSCLICDTIEQEASNGERLVLENESVIAYVPEAARYPYEVHMTTKTHRAHIDQLTVQEVEDLASGLRDLLFKYNQLFDFEMPYMMVHHQAPISAPEDPTYHWHIQFYPPYRTKDKLKYLAGAESGAGFFINDTIPEEKAAELRSIVAPND